MAAISHKTKAMGPGSTDQEKIKEEDHLSLEEAAEFFEEERGAASCIFFHGGRRWLGMIAAK